MYITAKILPGDGDVKDKKTVGSQRASTLRANVRWRCGQTTIVVVNKGGFPFEISGGNICSLVPKIVPLQRTKQI